MWFTPWPHKSWRLLHPFVAAAWVAGLMMVHMTAPQIRADLRESFESGTPSWRVREADCTYKIVLQERSPREAHHGQSCEHLRLVNGQGSFVHAHLAIEPARVISDLVPRLWLKANQQGLQLMARVVLPRSRDRETGQPLTALLRGDSYRDVGSWQQLSIRDVDRQLVRQTQVLRNQHGSQVDSREAYVDTILLNVLGKPGLLDVWIDDLEISGHISTRQVATGRSPSDSDAVRRATYFLGTSANRSDDAGTGSAVAPGADASAPNSAPLGSSVVRVVGGMLEAGGRPLMPRAIEHQGEPLAWLKSLGVNTVVLRAPATPEQLAEAQRLNLWLVTPPPSSPLMSSQQTERILAWDIGSFDGTADVHGPDQKIAQARAYGSQPRRPFFTRAGFLGAIPSPGAELVAWNEGVLGASFEFSQIHSCLAARLDQARGGLILAQVPSEVDPSLHAQCQLFAPEMAGAIQFDPEQLRMLAWSAIAAGARGIYFPSSQRLDAGDSVAEWRAVCLNWLNDDLSLFEPWVAGGSRCLRIPHDRAQVGILQTERAQLVLVQRFQTRDQHVLGVEPRQPISLVVPGSSASASAYLISPRGLIPLRHRRDSGGIRVTLEDAGRQAAVLVTSDPLVTNHMTILLTQRQGNAAKLRYEVLSRQANAVDRSFRQMAGFYPAATAYTNRLDDVQSNLRQCVRLLDQKNYQTFHHVADTLNQTLHGVQRACWEQAIQSGVTPGWHPGTALFSTLPYFWASAGTLPQAAWGGNSLAGGDFEDLEHVLTSGWRQRRDALDGYRTSVELSPDAPRQGKLSLRLELQALQASAGSPPTPPVAITSPPLRVHTGQWVRIQGWVRIPRKLQGDHGLVITDSLGGEILAERVQVTESWRPFVLYRAVPFERDLQVTFSLAGCGEAFLDEISVCVASPVARR